MAYLQLGKARVYQHVYEWLLVVVLLAAPRALGFGAWLALALTLIAIVAIQFASCAVDDIAGFRDGSDARNYSSSEYDTVHRAPLPKPLVAGILSVREGMIFALSSASIAIGAGFGAMFALKWDVPLAPMLGFVVVLGCAVQYSWGFAFSYRLGGLEFVIFIVNVATVLLPYMMIAGHLTGVAIIVSLLVGTWFLLVVSYGNVSDKEGDARAGRRTFAVVASVTTFNGFLVTLYLASVALAVLPFVLGMLKAPFALFLLPLVVLQSAQVYSGVVRGRTRRAFQMGFRSVDLGALGMAAAVILTHA